MSKHKLAVAIVETAVVLSVVSFVYLRHLNRVDFHIDESHWIGTSYMYEAYIRGRFWSDAWKESHETITNPPVPRYLIGMSRNLAGYRRSDINRIWNYDVDYDTNYRLGSIPSAGLLWWSRFPMVILAVLSIWLTFWAVKNIAGRVAAYFWILFATASAFLLVHTRRAMAESPILFFVVVAAVFTFLATERLTRERVGLGGRVWLYLAVSAISIGLAGASKMNGLAVLGMPLVCIAAALARRDEPVRTRLVQLVVLGLFVSGVAAAAFLASYPYLWPDLWGRTVHLFTNRLDEMRIQAAAFPQQRLDSWSQRLKIMPVRVLDEYASFSFRHVIYVNASLLVLGTCLTGFAIRDWARGKGQTSAALVLLATAVTASAPSFVTIIEWDRYYLFPVFFSSIASAIALGWLGRHLVVPIRVWFGRESRSMRVAERGGA